MDSLDTSRATKPRDEDIERYWNNIKKYPRITHAEEQELIKVKNGDQKAFNKLVCSNLWFVILVALQYQNCGIPLLDLISEGNIGLIKGIKKCKTSNTRLRTYVVFVIRGEIIKAIICQRRIVWIPFHQQERIQKIKKNLPHLVQILGREPSNLEIAKDTKFTEIAVAEAIEFNKQEISFDTPLILDDDNEYGLYNLVPDTSIPSPDEKIIEKSLTAEINKALKKLSEREAGVLTLYFGLNGNASFVLTEIATKYKLSRWTIMRTKSEALYKLKGLLEKNYLLEY